MTHLEYKNDFLLLQTMLDKVCSEPSTSLQSMRENIEALVQARASALANILPVYHRICCYKEEHVHSHSVYKK